MLDSKQTTVNKNFIKKIHYLSNSLSSWFSQKTWRKQMKKRRINTVCFLVAEHNTAFTVRRLLNHIWCRSKCTTCNIHVLHVDLANQKLGFSCWRKIGFPLLRNPYYLLCNFYCLHDLEWLTHFLKFPWKKKSYLRINLLVHWKVLKL